jgi:transcriptional regulator with XRE-family HTH domain
MDLKLYKIRKNLSNKILADRLGITKSYLSSILTGNIRPSGVVISRVIDYTEGEVTADTFFREQIDKWKNTSKQQSKEQPSKPIITNNELIIPSEFYLSTLEANTRQLDFNSSTPLAPPQSAETETEKGAKADAETDAGIETKARTRAETKTDAKADTEINTKIKTNTKTNTKTNLPINNNKLEGAFPIVNPQLREASNE